MSASIERHPGGTDPGPTRRMVVPAWMPRVAVVLLGSLLLSIGVARVQGFSPTVQPGQVLLERTLAFSDTADGAVRVIDVSTQETLDTLHGEQGFVRGVLRGLARERRLQSVAVEAPYLLSLRDDGRFLISDPSTGQRIDLASFGHDNAAAFARWLPSAKEPGQKTGLLTGVNKP